MVKLSQINPTLLGMIFKFNSDHISYPPLFSFTREGGRGVSTCDKGGEGEKKTARLQDRKTARLFLLSLPP